MDCFSTPFAGPGKFDFPQATPNSIKATNPSFCVLWLIWRIVPFIKPTPLSYFVLYTPSFMFTTWLTEKLKSGVTEDFMSGNYAFRIADGLPLRALEWVERISLWRKIHLYLSALRLAGGDRNASASFSRNAVNGGLARCLVIVANRNLNGARISDCLHQILECLRMRLA